MIRKITVAACIMVMSGLVFANIYTSMVDAVSWGSDMPRSVYTARDYYKAVNPGAYFRLFSPMCQLLAVLLLVACWKMGPKMRWLCFAGLLMSIGLDVFTFAYFYPRNNILLTETNIDIIRRSVHEWSSMNVVRTILGFITVFMYFIIQQKIYTKAAVVNS